MENNFSLIRIVEPDELPIELVDAKKHCIIAPSNTDQDSLLLSMIRAAVDYCENACKRQLCPATWRMTWDGGPPCRRIKLKYPRLIAVDSVTYRDPATGVQTTVDPDIYRVLTDNEPGAIVPTMNECWPQTACDEAAFTVTYQAGYANAAAVPDAFKHAIRLLVKHWFENRETVVVGTITAGLKYTVDDLIDFYQMVEAT